MSQSGYVCFGGVDYWYHSRAHSDVQLMAQLAREHTVLFVNSIGMRTPVPGRTAKFWRKVARKLGSTLRYLRRPRPDLPRFWVMTPLMLPPTARPWLRRWRARLLRWQVRAAARCVGVRDAVVVVTVPTAWDVVAPMPRRRLVYNRSDLHSAFAEGDAAMIGEVEAALLREADLVLYANRTLLERERAQVGARGRWLGHGVDRNLFHAGPHPEPEPMARVPRPRVGFVGALRDALVDFALLERVAREVPQCQLVLVGDAPSSLGALGSLPRVHWLGRVMHHEVPAYAAALDVALLPYRRTPWIEASSPIKLLEYLALGLRVVSTDFPAAREAGAIAVARDGDEFVALVRQALVAPLPAPPVVAEVLASWEQRAQQLRTWCEG